MNPEPVTEAADAISRAIEASPHYTVIFRPSDYLDNRLGTVHEAERLVRDIYVSRRGWDFPFMNSQKEAWLKKKNFISSWVLYDQHAEIWKLFLSGQFVFNGRVRETDPSYQRTIHNYTLGV